MNKRSRKAPLYEKLVQFKEKDPISFHVPGHKNGMIFPDFARGDFDSILKLDMTEIAGLDDLHAPSEVIAEAETLAAQFFGADHTFFLVGGSTAGNLAMILSACQAGEKIIVQRNSHKSIMNGLELRDAYPIFLAPVYDPNANRYTSPSAETLHLALDNHRDAKAVVLTYPDYFGKTYDMKQMIEIAHEYDIPVLVDEAHGVHFSLGRSLPASALELGADVVVQSAHKMTPAMTMASYLHIKSTLLTKDRIAHFLQMIQSSSPSYPLMASLDLARYFLQHITDESFRDMINSIQTVRSVFQQSDAWFVLPVSENDDPFKITLQMKNGSSAREIANLFEKEGIYPELITHNQILFIHGLAPFKKIDRLKKTVKRASEQLKNDDNHATIEIAELFFEPIQKLALSYETMNHLTIQQVPFHEGIGYIAAEAVIPYPPGIPIILKGERITREHVDLVEKIRKQGIRIQQREEGIRIYRT